jgi:predicted transposase/invertase (TIGR01784 family)
MNERRLISFDWAIKKVLRHKENFTVLEGFLSELLGFDIKIQSILEGEANKQEEGDKGNRVDILVKSMQGELMLIEVQYDDEIDYFHRMVYGISKLLTEYIVEGQVFGVVKKAYSINIMYFRIGQGKDYIYEYEGKFIGRTKKDTLKPTRGQKIKFGIETVADIFPKYYILRVGSFKKEEKITDTMDQWMYFLKNSEIKDEFTAKGLDEAKKVLKYENMSKADKEAYERHVYNVRIEKSVIETAEFKAGLKAARKNSIEVAIALLKEGSNKNLISTVTKLTLEEIDRLEKGEELELDIDKDSDDD